MKNNKITHIKEGIADIYAVLMIILLIITFPFYKKKLFSYIEEIINSSKVE